MNSKKIPATPLALYIKLYCKRTDEDVEKSNTFEATKSWLSLTEEERMVFEDKLNKLREDYKKQFARCLEKVEPYMKKKPPRLGCSEQIESCPVVEAIEDISNVQENIDCNEGTSGIHPVSRELQDQSEEEHQEIDHLESSHHMDMDDCHNQIEPEVPVPEPPAVKTAEELFNMIETGTNRSWQSLPKAEKVFYYKSVSALKKNYIQKYKAYLESLPSQELHQYYMRQKVL